MGLTVPPEISTGRSDRIRRRPGEKTMARRKRHTAEQIVKHLRLAEVEFGRDKPIKAIYEQIGGCPRLSMGKGHSVTQPDGCGH